jgi:uncharacterized protein
MKELLEYLINQISGSSKCELVESEDQNRVSFEVKAPPDVIGIIIGKEGRTIKAIQELMRVRARLESKLVYVNISENK